MAHMLIYSKIYYQLLLTLLLQNMLTTFLNHNDCNRDREISPINSNKILENYTAGFKIITNFQILTKTNFKYSIINIYEIVFIE